MDARSIVLAQPPLVRMICEKALEDEVDLNRRHWRRVVLGLVGKSWDEETKLLDRHLLGLDMDDHTTPEDVTKRLEGKKPKDLELWFTGHYGMPWADDNLGAGRNAGDALERQAKRHRFASTCDVLFASGVKPQTLTFGFPPDQGSLVAQKVLFESLTRPAIYSNLQSLFLDFNAAVSLDILTEVLLLCPATLKHLAINVSGRDYGKGLPSRAKSNKPPFRLRSVRCALMSWEYAEWLISTAEDCTVSIFKPTCLQGDDSAVANISSLLVDTLTYRSPEVCCTYPNVKVVMCTSWYEHALSPRLPMPQLCSLLPRLEILRVGNLAENTRPTSVIDLVREGGPPHGLRLEILRTARWTDEDVDALQEACAAAHVTLVWHEARTVTEGKFRTCSDWWTSRNRREIRNDADAFEVWLDTVSAGDLR